MSTFMEQIPLATQGEGDIRDITRQVQKIIQRSGIKNGLVCVFNPGSTGSVTTLEYEPGLLADLPGALERMAPKDATYQHELRWHDGNGHSHVRASIIGPSVTIPIHNGDLLLGTWQQIVFVELDVPHRSRTLVVQIVGDP